MASKIASSLSNALRGGGQTECAGCHEGVYPLERIQLGEKNFHRGCAKCSHCHQTLTLTNFASANNMLFCKPHFLELFKSSGGKYAFAENGNPKGNGENSAANHSSKPNESKLAYFTSNTVAGTPLAAATSSVTSNKAEQPSTSSALNGMSIAEKLAAFSNASIAQQQLQTAKGQPAPLQPAKAVVSAAHIVVEAPKPLVQTQLRPVNGSSSKLASVQEAAKPKAILFDAFIDKSTSKGVAPMPVNPSAEAKVINPKPASSVSINPTSSSVTKLATPLVAISTSNNSDPEKEGLRKRVKELETEVENLKARIDIGNAGKEYLVEEIMRLKRQDIPVVQSNQQQRIIQPAIPLPPAPMTSFADPLTQAKKLLVEGRISAKEFEARSKALSAARDAVQRSHS